MHIQSDKHNFYFFFLKKKIKNAFFFFFFFFNLIKSLNIKITVTHIEVLFYNEIRLVKKLNILNAILTRPSTTTKSVIPNSHVKLVGIQDTSLGFSDLLFVNTNTPFRYKDKIKYSFWLEIMFLRN